MDFPNDSITLDDELSKSTLINWLYPNQIEHLNEDEHTVSTINASSNVDEFNSESIIFTKQNHINSSKSILSENNLWNTIDHEFEKSDILKHFCHFQNYCMNQLNQQAFMVQDATKHPLPQTESIQRIFTPGPDLCERLAGLSHKEIRAVVIHDVRLKSLEYLETVIQEGFWNTTVAPTVSGLYTLSTILLDPDPINRAVFFGQIITAAGQKIDEFIHMSPEEQYYYYCTGLLMIASEMLMEKGAGLITKVNKVADLAKHADELTELANEADKITADITPNRNTIEEILLDKDNVKPLSKKEMTSLKAAGLDHPLDPANRFLHKSFGEDVRGKQWIDDDTFHLQIKPTNHLKSTDTKIEIDNFYRILANHLHNIERHIALELKFANKMGVDRCVVLIPENQLIGHPDPAAKQRLMEVINDNDNIQPTITTDGDPAFILEIPLKPYPDNFIGLTKWYELQNRILAEIIYNPAYGRIFNKCDEVVQDRIVFLSQSLFEPSARDDFLNSFLNISNSDEMIDLLKEFREFNRRFPSIENAYLTLSDAEKKLMNDEFFSNTYDLSDDSGVLTQFEYYRKQLQQIEMNLGIECIRSGHGSAAQNRYLQFCYELGHIQSWEDVVEITRRYRQ